MPCRHGDDTGWLLTVARRLWSLVILMVMGTGWGLSFSLARLATSGGAHPFGITFWQTLVGAVALIAILAARRKIPPCDRSTMGLYVACGLLGAAAPSILFYYAAAHLTAGVLSISTATIPILTFVLSACFRLERLAPLRVLGVTCGAAAIVVLIAPKQSLPDPGLAPWVVVACAASACYALWNLIVARYGDRRRSALVIACGMYVSATILIIPVLVMTDSFVSLMWPFGVVEWAIMGMGMISAIAYSLFVYLVGRSGPVFASQASYIVTLSGVFWGVIIFGEQHSSWIWMSLAIMCAALALVSPWRSGTVADK